VTAALIIQDDRVLIAQRAAPPSLKGFWEFPGGKLEDGESLEECLIREIREELEVEISISRWYGESIYEYDSGSINLQAFVCVLEKGSLKPNAHSKLVWSSLEELSQWQFLPADIPFVERLVAEGIPV
jgi:mutator protein MutT